VTESPHEDEVPEEVAAESEQDEVVTPEGEDVPSEEEPAEPTAEEQLAERTADLQRLQAEYLNYKKRVDRDRDTVRKGGEAAVLNALLTTLDDIGRADEHGELVGGFKAIAESLQAVVAKFGLESFGAEGEPFDPQLHEAVFHVGESADVDVTSIGKVMLVGYRVGDRVLRPATVGVVDPVSASAEQDEESVDDEE